MGRATRWIKRRWSKTRSSRRAFIVAIFAAFLNFLLMFHLPSVPFSGLPAALLEPRLMDLWFIIRGRTAAPDKVLLIAVDERSHEELQVSSLAPWPRNLLAQLLEKLANYKPRAIVLDYRFRMQTNSGDDDRLAAAMKLSPTFIASFTMQREEVSPDGALSTSIEKLDPNPLFKQSAKGLFPANLVGTGGIVRSFYLHEINGRYQTPFASILAANGDNPESFPGFLDYINYYGPPGAIKTLPFYRIIKDEQQLTASDISGKFIFVGQRPALNYTAEQSDTFLTPFHMQTSGVEIHATCAGNILDASWIRRLPPYYEVLYLLCAAIILSYYLLKLRPARGALLLAAAMSAWPLISYFMFINRIFLPGSILIYIVLPLVFVFSCIQAYFNMRRLEIAIGLDKSA